MIGSPPGFFITSLRLLPEKQQIRTHDQSAKGSDYIVLVEHKGVEPLASTMPLWRATNCANAPQQFNIIADSAQPVKRCGV